MFTKKDAPHVKVRGQASGLVRTFLLGVRPYFRSRGSDQGELSLLFSKKFNINIGVGSPEYNNCQPVLLFRFFPEAECCVAMDGS